MTRKIPITDGITRDPLDTESVRSDESLYNSESSGSEESVGPGEKRSGVKGDEVGDKEVESKELNETGAEVGVDVGSEEEEADGAVLETGSGVGETTTGVGATGLGVGSGVDTEGQENSTS